MKTNAIQCAMEIFHNHTNQSINELVTLSSARSVERISFKMFTHLLRMHKASMNRTPSKTWLSLMSCLRLKKDLYNQ